MSMAYQIVPRTSLLGMTETRVDTRKVWVWAAMLTGCVAFWTGVGVFIWG